MDWRRRKERARAWVEARPWAAVPVQTVKEFVEDEAPLHAAALAFFSLFAVAPLLVLVIVAGSVAMGDGESARSQLLHGAGTLLGEKNADALQSLIANARFPGGGLVASAVGVLVLVYTASRVFAYLEVSLNRIWDVEVKKDGRSLLRTVRKRLFSSAMVLVLAFLLLVSLVISGVLAGVFNWLEALVPWDPVVFLAVRIVTSVAVLAGLFVLLYKALPAARIEWRDAAIGAVVTAVLFTVGQVAAGQVVAGSRIASAFGGLASIVVVLLWFYYTALAFLLGAEFTQVWATRHGKPLRPDPEVAQRAGRKSAPEA